MEQLHQDIAATVAKVLSLNPMDVTPDLTFTDMGVDFLDVVNIVFELEMNFKVRFPDDVDLKALKNVREVARTMQTLLAH